MSQCFTSPNYWGYEFQQILQGDVQNPQNKTFTNGKIDQTPAILVGNLGTPASFPRHNDDVTPPWCKSYSTARRLRRSWTWRSLGISGNLWESLAPKRVKNHHIERIHGFKSPDDENSGPKSPRMTLEFLFECRFSWIMIYPITHGGVQFHWDPPRMEGL